MDTKIKELIAKTMSYDPATGDLRWKVDVSAKCRAGMLAGSFNDVGVKRTVCIGRKQMQAHHVAWFLHHGEWPAKYVKAHDGNLTNLQIANLYESDTAHTPFESRPGGESGVKGITWDVAKNKWFVKVTRNYKQIAIGRFAELDDAKAALTEYLANPDAPKVAKPKGRPRRVNPAAEDVKFRERQHAVWRRMMQHNGGFTAWPHFDAFAKWVGGEPKAWGIMAEDPMKPVGPDNFKWIDKPENKHNRDCKESMKAYRKERREAKPDMYRGHELKRAYGMTVEDYAKMLEEQGGVCAICKKPETHVKNGKIAMLAVDHCHTGGQVRGLLCVKCNLGIGYFKDNIDTLEKAVAYLEKHA